MLDPAASDRAAEIPAELQARRAFEQRLLPILPDLRAFARFLTRNPTEADDLVQDTVVRALRGYRQFDLQTNIKAWAFTILRNLHKNRFRTRVFEVLDEEVAALWPCPPNQIDRVELGEVLAMLVTLAPAHRDVVVLVRASGLSYGEAAQVMKCKVGTIKSRLNRADAALRDALGPEFRESRRAVNPTYRRASND